MGDIQLRHGGAPEHHLKVLPLEAYHPRRLRPTSRSMSRFFILSRFSYFFFPRTIAISILIRPLVVYTFIGMIVNPRFSAFPAREAISFLWSKSFLVRSRTYPSGVLFG